MSELETTLCILKQNDQILLAMKKRGLGEGRFNGIGGKIEKGETPEQAMIRETKEEIFVEPVKYEKVGLIEFDEFNNKGERVKGLFHLYLVHEWKGTPKESEEMKPKWFLLDNIPYSQMFPDDKYWLPLVLDNRKVKAYFQYDREWNLLEKKVEEINDK